MRHDVHLAALGAAARVACSVALLEGCGGTTAELAEPIQPATDYASSEAELAGGTRRSATGTAPSPCHDAGAPRASCESVLASTFGDAGWPEPGSAYPPEVGACCKELGADADYDSPFHWPCCAALNWEGMACTPWGPPVPPSMPRHEAVA